MIHKILTTPQLREELFARVEVEIPNQEDRKIVKEILSRSKSNFPSERFLLYNLVHITDYAKFQVFCYAIHSRNIITQEET